MKDLSIIIPVYNGEKYIERCIKSITQTTGITYEIIIINDASTDKTEEKIKQLKNKSIIKIALPQNKGVSYCRNLGIQKATGKYIAFSDVDDYIEKNMYETMVKEAEKNQLDVCCCNYYEIFEKTGKKVKSKYNLKNEIIYKPNIIKQFLIDEISPSCCDKIYKADLIKNNIKIDEELQIGEDILFILNVMNTCEKLGTIENYFYNYIQQEKSVMHTISAKFLQFEKVVEKTKNIEYEKMRIDNKEEYEYFEGAMLVRGIHSISTLVNKENKKQAINYIEQLRNKDILKKWIKNPYVNKFIKLEIKILLLLGTKMHLLLMPIYKYMRNKLRK